MRFKLLFLSLLAVLVAGCAGNLPHPESGSLTEGGTFETGVASYYAKKFEGRRTASGQRYDGDKLTAAHRTLPFGTRVRVRNLANDTSVVVTVNDRGPHRKGRVIDVSRRAARALGFIGDGTAQVALEIVDP
jgi:peptidoglycan lytic transglycosylase